MHAHPLGVTTGEQSRTRRGAHWRGHHEACEFPTFLRDAVDIRRANGLGAETAQVAVTLVVGKNDDEIGLGAMHGFGGDKEHGK